MRRAVTGVHGCASHLVTASTPRDRRVRAAIEFMAGHLAGPVSVAEVARHVSVSPAHLYRLFRSQPGEAPHHVLRLLRLAKGADLLSVSALGVKEVAAQVGYRYVGNFARGFASIHLRSGSLSAA